MSISTVFTNNRSQAVCLPPDMRLPPFVKRVTVRARGMERIITPTGVNDIHIAAPPRSEGLTLMTNNLSEFERLPALQLENWVD